MKNTINWRGDHCLDYCGPHDYNTFNAINRYGQSDNRAKWGGWVNDCHSQLNRTKVSKILRPLSRVELIRIVNDARKSGRSVMPFGGKHAMGSQQFGSGTLAIDMRGLNKVLSLEQKTGILEVEAGICWPEIMAFLETPRASHGKHAGNHGWSIAQKQTGADELTLGGALAANIHGRGLNKRPIIEDVQSFTLINAEGRFRECSRSQNEDLFKLVIGGYGLFGLIYSVRIQLIPREKLKRVVRSIDAGSLMESFRERIADCFCFGDFQFQIDDRSDDFLRKGIFSCYKPVPDRTEMLSDIPGLRKSDWLNLLHLAHVDKSRGFDLYQKHYQRTDGAVYWSDSHQFTTYVDGYHQEIDRRMESQCRGSEMISELYVPRDRLPRFLSLAREDLRCFGASVIYGTVRLIEQEHESFLNWARRSWACVIFNICVEHSQQGLRNARRIFRGLIDRALEQEGSYYLTYHKFASRAQVEAGYPQFAEFLRLKNEYDPRGLFQSNWWRHHETLFADA